MNFNSNTIQQFFAPYLWMSWIILSLVIWSLIWKGIALWKAARNSHKVWFIVLLILNTVGILEIIYIFCYGRKKSPPAVQGQ